MVPPNFPLRKMIDKAFEWAKANKRLRSNPVHGEDEVNIVLTETFQLEDCSIEESNQSGNFEVQAGPYNFWSY